MVVGFNRLSQAVDDEGREGEVLASLAFMFLHPSLGFGDIGLEQAVDNVPLASQATSIDGELPGSRERLYPIALVCHDTRVRTLDPARGRGAISEECHHALARWPEGSQRVGVSRMGGRRTPASPQEPALARVPDLRRAHQPGGVFGTQTVRPGDLDTC